jgi:hypothetical protein
MSRPPLALLSVALLLALASAAHGLVVHYEHEEVGPARDVPVRPGTDPESTFRFSRLRCYWRETGFDGWGVSRRDVVAAFRGDVDQANAALATFATLPDEGKLIRLVPGPGSVRSLGEKASYPCDWEVRWMRNTEGPRGERTKSTVSRTAVLTLFIARADPIARPDPRAAGWVKELDDDRFPVREKASRALADLGDAAMPALRAALEQNPTLEQRRRIERLLDRLKPIHLSRVKLPKGVRTVSLDELVKEAEKGWRSGKIAESWFAATQFTELAEYSEDTFALLVEALRDDRVQVRELSEKAFARLGNRGAAALAKLKAADAGASGPGDALKRAVRSVSEGTDRTGVEEYWRHNRRLRAAIVEYCRAIAKPS